MSRLSADEVSFFKEYGYLLKSNVLDPELCARARDQLWATATPPLRRDEPRTWTGPIEPQHETEELSGHHWFPHADHVGGPDDIRQQLVTRNEQVLRWARQLLGEDNVDLSARARSRGIICNLPVAEQRRSLKVGVVPNTDDGLGYERCHNDGHGMHLGVVGLLDDVDLGGGATMIWPASHRRVFHLYSQQCMNARQAHDGATITRQQAFSDGLQEEDSAFGAEMRRLNLDTRAKKRPLFHSLVPFPFGKNDDLPRQARAKVKQTSRRGGVSHTYRAGGHLRHSGLCAALAPPHRSHRHGQPLQPHPTGKKAPLLAPFYTKKGSIHQDRPGTTAGKVEKRVAFIASDRQSSTISATRI